MVLIYDGGRPAFQGQNIRPPLGSIFNGRSYGLALYPELGRHDRAVLVVRMVLQFQFDDSDDASWTAGEKTSFARDFVNSVEAVWSEKFRITTTHTTPNRNLRDVGVRFEFPYFIDGWHTSDDFELSVRRIPSGDFNVSSCAYSLGNTYLDSEDAVGANKGASMTQRGTVHEFGHMLGLRDEYSEANANPHHTGDRDSVMNGGEVLRERHYAPFADWITEQFAYLSRLAGSQIEYKVEGRTDMANAQL